MKQDNFDLDPTQLTPADRAWRVIALACFIGVVLMDLFVWRP